jgi:hypothetical protein
MNMSSAEATPRSWLRKNPLEGGVRTADRQPEEKRPAPAWKSADYRDVVRELKKERIPNDELPVVYRERLGAGWIAAVSFRG